MKMEISIFRNFIISGLLFSYLIAKDPINFEHIDKKITLPEENPINVVDIDKNAISQGIDAIFNSTNKFLNYKPALGINYLLDSILSFYVLSAKNSHLNEQLKLDLEELMIQFKYKTAVLVNGHFKPFRTDIKLMLELTEKELLIKLLKHIFRNLIYMLMDSEELTVYLKKVIKKLLRIIGIVSDDKVDKTELEVIKRSLDDLIKRNPIEEKRNKNKFDKQLMQTILSNIFDQFVEYTNNQTFEHSMA